mgnify:CR=1 FL=1
MAMAQTLTPQQIAELLRTYAQQQRVLSNPFIRWLMEQQQMSGVLDARTQQLVQQLQNQILQLTGTGSSFESAPPQRFAELQATPAAASMPPGTVPGVFSPGAMAAPGASPLPILELLRRGGAM